MEIYHKQRRNRFQFGISAVDPFFQGFSVDVGTFFWFSCQVEPCRTQQSRHPSGFSSSSPPEHFL